MARLIGKKTSLGWHTDNVDGKSIIISYWDDENAVKAGTHF